ncbi:MAG: hypothetical protein CMA72_01335 [Euryarchaeota archaeon]|nr:hypothetical protein [Euryarchaeota archaeon]
MIIPSLFTISNASWRLAGRCTSGTSIITIPVGDGSGIGDMMLFSGVADAAFHAVVSATTSFHGRERTEVHDSAEYLRISRSNITPNFPPSSMILKEDGRLESAAAHASNSHAARCPIPPPTRTTFSGVTLAAMSRILDLASRERSGRSMCSICWPIFAAISGSSVLNF